MKLFYCPACEDIQKMTFTKRECQCGESAGMYINDLEAFISGVAVPIGIDNFSLIDGLSSVKNRTGDGVTAFVIGGGACRINDSDIQYSKRKSLIAETQRLLNAYRENKANERESLINFILGAGERSF